jgi:hypothetical protein
MLVTGSDWMTSALTVVALPVIPRSTSGDSATTCCVASWAADEESLKSISRVASMFTRTSDTSALW